jgi:two-component system chemotaxis sensor kinase CheA
MPVDVAELPAAYDTTVHRQTGITGSQIAAGKTILHVDLEAIVHAANIQRGIHWDSAEHGHPMHEQPVQKSASDEKSPLRHDGKILLAEDSDFFRSQVRRLLQADGYTVIEAPDGQAAWELLLDHVHDVALVVTDIEMPHLNGFELTRRIRNDARTLALPVIAVTTLAGEDDIARGKQAGVNDYQVKMDRETLLQSVRHYMHASSAAAPGSTPQSQTTSTY